MWHFGLERSWSVNEYTREDEYSRLPSLFRETSVAESDRTQLLALTEVVA